MISNPKTFAAILIVQMGTLGFTLSTAQVADPTITVAGGPSTSPQTELVTVNDSTSGTTIYYTTDGTTPKTSSAIVTTGSTLLISQNATLKVQAYYNGSISDLVTSKYTNAGTVSAGARHTLILKTDGTVWATGDNTYGELGNGDGSGTAQPYPVQVMVSSGTPLTGIVSLSAGTDESFAVDNSGNVWAWGYNPNGQLAIGTTTNAVYATQIVTLANMLSVASNQYHTLAVQANGTVWSWGANTTGQVGNGSTASWITQPTEVVATNGQSGNLTGIIAVAAGASHSLALDNTGKVWAWGLNSSGQLGDGDSTLATETSPVSVLKSGSPLVNVLQVAANSTDSFAFRNDGTIYSWGDNTTGELGNGTATSSVSALQVGGLTGYMAAATNEAAVDPNGLVWTWGANSNGQLGIGYTGYYSTLPLEVNPLAIGSPTLTVTAGNGQTVTDGSSSAPFTINASSGQGTWVNLVVNPTSGALGLSSGATQLSPIIGGTTGSNGSINFYLVGSGSGTVTLTATSGNSQTTLSAIEQMLMASGEPTMPQWMLIFMAALLVYFAARPRTRITA